MVRVPSIPSQAPTVPAEIAEMMSQSKEEGFRSIVADLDETDRAELKKMMIEHRGSLPAWWPKD